MSAPTQTDVTYRWLEPHELPLIDPLIAKHGEIALNEQTSRVLVAEHEGRIVGFHVFQLMPFVGPLWVDSAFRGSNTAPELADRMLDFLKEARCRGFIVFATSPHAEKLCVERGMQPVLSQAYVWQGDKQ